MENGRYKEKFGNMDPKKLKESIAMSMEEMVNTYDTEGEFRYNGVGNHLENDDGFVIC